MVKRILLVVLAVFLSSVAAFAQDQLVGAVRDEVGGAISGAHISVQWDPSGSDAGLKSNVGIRQTLNLTTDAAGLFSAELPPGFYDVFVSATAFSPECTKIRITAGKTATYNAKMKVSSLVVKELGDRFPTK